MDQTRQHAATVEINRGMKGEYSIRTVARADNDTRAAAAAAMNIAIDTALAGLQCTEERLGIASAWHTHDTTEEENASGE